MATASRLDRLLETVRSYEEADRTSRAQAEQELARLDERLAKHSAIKRKLESHMAAKSQLNSDIQQLKEDMQKQLPYGDLSDYARLDEFIKNVWPVTQTLRSQQEEKFKCLRDLESREPALLDDIGAEDIYLHDSTPSDDEDCLADRHEDVAAPHDDRDRPDSVSEPSADAPSRSLQTSSGRPTKVISLLRVPNYD